MGNHNGPRAHSYSTISINVICMSALQYTLRGSLRGISGTVLVKVQLFYNME